MRASDRAYATLREDIVEWRLRPGAVLAEVEQSERLGVSRTPLREALGRLTAEGLTTAAGGRGVVVTDISLDSIDELFEQRSLVIIEWADKFSECLPEDHLSVSISQDADAIRTATIRAGGG